ncbi:ABC transporter permease [Planosporangium mesophilum]|uniref:Exporter of polyketide antibiotics n=1 Tax=Planosporangium mesophilum TaxID=689768 RepID=A0A8J3X779_9ACTN|nr:ABC transporter permease [Planosporangium mesophilum]NJC86741.1 ABC transporter permease [Planosporangium mesophilum]GII26418.1 exporter of polyketide antibiotics [Planosporangium mesophilum]
MTSFTGTGALARLALRLDRVRLPAWVLVIGLTPAATAAQYKKLYPDEHTIQQVAGVITNPSLVALNGPLFAPTLGGLTAWKIGMTEFVLAALMSLLTVVRHTRAEEETGRLELVRAGVVGRYAPLTAALLVTGLANLACAVLVALGLVGTGLPVTGSVAFGVAVGLVGLVFAAVAAAAAQLTDSARSAVAIASAVLGAAYLLRAVGDTGPTWLTWLSPIGWAMRVRAFAGERWWPLGVAVAGVAVLTVVAYTLVGRRDLGAGLLPQRHGPAQASPGLRSPLALAWRLHRGLLIGWLIGMALSGAVLGGAAGAIGDAIGANPQITDLMARLGGGRKALVDAYLAAVFGIVGLVAAVYTVQATLRLRAEEAGGRVEPLLATPVGRIRWAASHLVVALLGTTVLLAVAGSAGGLGYGLQIHDVGGQTPRLLAAALVQLPAAWVLAGLGAALFGLAPRLAAGLTWAGLGACLLLFEVGAMLGLSRWLVDASPFAHVPKLPGAAVTATPLLALTAITVALIVAGLAGFRSRDLG